MSPSDILKIPASLKMFFNKISDLSAKKLKLVLSKSISFEILTFKFETEPRAIKLLNKLLSSRYTSISVLIFPC